MQNYFYNPYVNQQFRPPYQMPQQVPEQQMYGKIIQSVDSITPNDVPMDGNTAFFPLHDMSAIYAKSWQPDGTIRTRLYKAVLDADVNNLPPNAERAKIDLSEEATEVFMKRFDELVGKIDRLEQELSKKRNLAVKKESVE